MTPKPDSAPVSSAATGLPNVSLKLDFARFVSWLKTLKANPTHYLYGKAGW